MLKFLFILLMHIDQFNKVSYGLEADWAAEWNPDAIKDFIKIIHKRRWLTQEKSKVDNKIKGLLPLN